VRLSIGCAASNDLVPTCEDPSLLGLMIIKVPSSSEATAGATREGLLRVPGVVDAFVFPYRRSRVPGKIYTARAHLGGGRHTRNASQGRIQGAWSATPDGRRLSRNSYQADRKRICRSTVN
jgi:hypothetical protein